MAIIKQRREWMLAVAGDQTRGWGPAGSGVPGTTRNLLFDFRIESNPGGGYILAYASKDGTLFGDTWHETRGEAERVAFEEFKVPPSAWEPLEGEPAG